MITATRCGIGLAVALAALVGCGGGSETTLDKADKALAKLQRGEFTVAVQARAGQAGGATAGPVGFTLGGRFDMATGTALPVLDLKYTRALGDTESTMAIKSDGTRMVVITDGVPVEVPPEQARRLNLGDGDAPGGLGDLGVSGWITNPKEASGPEVDGVATRRVTGPIDAADVISDLAVLAGQVSGQENPPELERETAERIQSRVQSGDVEVLIGPDDLPRRARATVDFGSQVGPELQKALGPYAAAGLEVTLELRAPGAPVTPPSLP